MPAIVSLRRVNHKFVGMASTQTVKQQIVTHITNHHLGAKRLKLNRLPMISEEAGDIEFPGFRENFKNPTSHRPGSAR